MPCRESSFPPCPGPVSFPKQRRFHLRKNPQIINRGRDGMGIRLIVHWLSPTESQSQDWQEILVLFRRTIDI